MTVIDADAHVVESLETFGERYLDPAYWSRRPQAARSDQRDYWHIDGHLFPRYSGRGCHIIGTPTGGGGVKTHLGRKVADARASNQLSDPRARVREMLEEEIDLQVIYPTLFLLPLTADAGFGSALCRAYNNWIAERCRQAPDHLRWVAVVNLEDVESAVAEIERVKAELDPVGVMILGTAGEKLLNHPSLFPFFAAVESADLPIAVHVGWSLPSLANMYSSLPESLIVPFTMPLLMGFTAFTVGGLLDRFPGLRVAFLELGCEWVPFLTGRIEHQYRFFQKQLTDLLAMKRRPIDYLRSGQVYVGCEVDDPLLPHVIDLMGEEHLLYGSDIPHGDRDYFTVRALRKRDDIPASVKPKILTDNPRRFYRL
jgi:predicted TIM-barrel fold metal-dependent hydrolase